MVSNQYQIFHYTRSQLRAFAPAGNSASFEEKSRRWRALANTISHLTSMKRAVPPALGHFCDFSGGNTILTLFGW